MPRSKVVISLDRDTLKRLDRLIRQAVFPNRSQAVQAAVDEKLARLDRRLLAQECAKLDPVFERALAEEGMSEVLASRPEY
jgi:metal-responsive CopG/Arc/MetJ family transcriptional regulator